MGSILKRPLRHSLSITLMWAFTLMNCTYAMENGAEFDEVKMDVDGPPFSQRAMSTHNHESRGLSRAEVMFQENGVKRRPTLFREQSVVDMFDYQDEEIPPEMRNTYLDAAQYHQKMFPCIRYASFWMGWFRFGVTVTSGVVAGGFAAFATENSTLRIGISLATFFPFVGIALKGAEKFMTQRAVQHETAAQGLYNALRQKSPQELEEGRADE